jgi:hypothetical protein
MVRYYGASREGETLDRVLRRFIASFMVALDVTAFARSRATPSRPFTRR